MKRQPPRTPLFPYTPLFRSRQTVVPPRQLDERLAGLGLDVGGVHDRQPPQGEPLGGDEVQELEGVVRDRLVVLDRKSTRLNSSHANISYAVFCLKKKKIKAF